MNYCISKLNLKSAISFPFFILFPKLKYALGVLLCQSVEEVHIDGSFPGGYFSKSFGNLYRCRELLAQGIPLGGSTDAPFGSADPWAAMRAAVQRKSRSGKTLGREERLSPEQALDLFTCAAQDPGGVSRKIAVGEAADLCLLNRPWEQARLRLCSTDVRATFRSGTLVYHQEQPISPGRHHAIVAA